MGNQNLLAERKISASPYPYVPRSESQKQKKFRQEHQAELELYESAVKFFKEKNADGKIPSMKSLKTEKEKLPSSDQRNMRLINTLKNTRKNCGRSAVM